MQNLSNENEFDLHENGCAGETHFDMNGFRTKTRLICFNLKLTLETHLK